MMPALDDLLIVALTFLLAGFVKGMTGLGLPSISLAILTVTMGLQPAGDPAHTLVPHQRLARSRRWPSNRDPAPHVEPAPSLVPDDVARRGDHGQNKH